MAVAGALIGGAIGAYGKKPKVPALADINPDLIQQQTAAGNIASFADIAKLATMTNQFSQDQLDALLDRTLPGVRQAAQENILSMSRGEVPEDVSRAITRYQAGRNVGALTSGSGFANSSAARQLGLTSLSLIDKGLSSAESWLSRAAAPQMDVTAMFFTPQQRLAFAERDRSARFERDLMAAQVKAAPDPATAALGKEIDRFFNTWAQVGTGMLGSMGGGGGGMGGMPEGASYMSAADQQSRLANGTSRFGSYNWLNSSVNAGSANGQGL
jgi:hypothetical protein